MRYDEKGHLQIYKIRVDVTETRNNTSILEPFLLNQNYPNPFNITTTISYNLPCKITGTIHIFNIQGMEIKTLKIENQSAGIHEITWDGKDSQNNNVVSGVYFYRLKLKNGFSQTRKMILLK